jgi:hypothetical protein
MAAELGNTSAWVVVNTLPRIVIHPKDSNTVYVAACGNEYTANPERGIYKTTDGGANWNKVLYEDEMTGGYDW